MKIIKQNHEFLTPINGLEIMKDIEIAARTCYKSEDKISDGSAETLCKSLVGRHHYAMIEFGPSITIRFITDRGVTHELVRHRLCSFAQESTRYVGYDKGKFGSECVFIEPVWLNDVSSQSYKLWEDSMLASERYYMELRQLGWKPEQARSVLPNSLKTEIIVKANLREWAHVLTLRTDKAAHPQIRHLMIPVLNTFKQELPILFGDINNE